MDMFEVNNEQGVNQLTSLNSTFYLVRKVYSRDLPITDYQVPGTDIHLYFRELYVEAEYPIVAVGTVSLDKGTKIDSISKRPDGRWLIRFYDTSDDYHFPKEQRNIDTIFYVYDLRINADPTNNFGLNLYDPTGKCVYSSNQFPLKVVDVFDVPLTYTGPYIPTLSSKAIGKDLAIISDYYRVGYGWNYPGEETGYIEFFSTGNGEVRVNYGIPQEANFSFYFNRTPKVTVIDVTGI